MAQDATTLLKNAATTLPLSERHGGPVAVIGPSASASPTYAGGGCAYVIPSQTVTPLQGIESAAGAGAHVIYRQGLPTDNSPPRHPRDGAESSLRADVVRRQLSGNAERSCHRHVCAYALEPVRLLHAHRSVPRRQAAARRSGNAPGSVYSVAVGLRAGQTYTLSITSESSSLSWGTPSYLAPGIASAVAAAKSASRAVVVVSDNTESEAADRLSLDLPSAQNELVSAVAAVNPRTVVVV